MLSFQAVPPSLAQAVHFSPAGQVPWFVGSHCPPGKPTSRAGSPVVSEVTAPAVVVMAPSVPSCASTWMLATHAGVARRKARATPTRRPIMRGRLPLGSSRGQAKIMLLEPTAQRDRGEARSARGEDREPWLHGSVAVQRSLAGDGATAALY